MGCLTGGIDRPGSSGPWLLCMLPTRDRFSLRLIAVVPRQYLDRPLDVLAAFNGLSCPATCAYPHTQTPQSRQSESRTSPRIDIVLLSRYHCTIPPHSRPWLSFCRQSLQPGVPPPPHVHRLLFPGFQAPPLQTAILHNYSCSRCLLSGLASDQEIIALETCFTTYNILPRFSTEPRDQPVSPTHLFILHFSTPANARLLLLPLEGRECRELRVIKIISIGPIGCPSRSLHPCWRPKGFLDRSFALPRYWVLAL
ncbi:hypothetical protein FJTKL_11612 [Diaporthe vaccinii]|uniref:Uncharacterized protein n=1 Tax=Diaporthe vaccinii TaxID=105482 RepID=A0ABR4EG98_9PEZI